MAINKDYKLGFDGVNNTMFRPLSLQHQGKIINVNDPTDRQDVATKVYTDKVGPRHGFEVDINDKTTLNFNSGSRTFTLTHISDYKYYIQGVEYENTANDSVTVTDTEGIWYIYYNTDGTLTASQSIWSLTTQVSVTLIYWDATNNKNIIFAQERHTEAFSGVEHDYHHQTQGTKYASGFVGTIYSAPNADKITITIGEAHDEDIEITVTDGTGNDLFEQDLSTTDAYSRLPVFYRNGAVAWRKFNATDHPFWDDNGVNRVYHNTESAGNWTVTEAGNNKYVAYWIFVTDEKDEPIMVIMGQGDTENTLANAKANYTPDSLDLGTLPVAEIKLLYRIIIKNNSIEDITDYRTTTGTAVSSFVTNSHSSLSNLGNDDHPQYLLTDGTRAVTGSFEVTGDIYINYDAASNDSYLYFGDDTDPEKASLQWDSGDNRFYVNSVNGLWVLDGEVKAATSLQCNTDIYLLNSFGEGDRYIYFYDGGSPTGASLKWDNSNNWFEFNKGLKSNVNILADGNFYANYSGGDGDSFIYFYETNATGRYLKWDDGSNRFEFNDSLAITGFLTATSNITSDSFVWAKGNMHIGSSDADHFLYFYETNTTGRYLKWDDGSNRFEFNDDVSTSGQFQGASADIGGEMRCNSFRIDQTPAVGGGGGGNKHLTIDCNGVAYTVLVTLVV